MSEEEKCSCCGEPMSGYGNPLCSAAHTAARFEYHMLEAVKHIVAGPMTGDELMEYLRNIVAKHQAGDDQ